MAGGPVVPAREYTLTEAVLHSGGRVDRWEDKAAFSLLFEYETVPTPAVPSAAEIRRSDIVDLTAKMAKDGTLNWEVPPGKWTILRMGYSLTGSKNRPAPPSGLGYEADKLSRKYMEAYFHGYIDPIAQALGPLFGKSLRYLMMDSWEAGAQNWTDEMMNEFRARRGYDPTPYLPAMAGRVVESADVSDRFLWDFRRTLDDLFAENTYGTMAEMARQRGIGIYAEAAGVSLEIPEDTLLNKSKVEIPMGEFWVHALHPELMYYQDVRGAASASHVYGKKLVATESFTGGGYEAPYTLKKIGDYWFAQGVNRIVFHTSAHQPLDTKPGNTMVGTHINRNITWAEQAKPFMTYLARNSFMLQQGLFVADLAYLLPEGAPSTMPIWGAGLQPAPPDGYDYDYINTDVLLNRLSVKEDGRLALPDGMSYRVLVLPEIDRMTPRVAAQNSRAGGGRRDRGGAEAGALAEPRRLSQRRWRSAGAGRRPVGRHRRPQRQPPLLWEGPGDVGCAAGRCSGVDARCQGLRLQPGVGCRYAVDSSPRRRCRHLLRSQPDGCRAGCGSALPCERQAGGTLASRYRGDRAGGVCHRRRPHDGAIAFGGTRGGVRGLPARGCVALAHPAARNKHDIDDPERAVGREFPAEPGGAGEDPTGEAGVVDRERG